jgi:hypothetical protein
MFNTFAKKFCEKIGLLINLSKKMIFIRKMPLRKKLAKIAEITLTPFRPKVLKPSE